MPLYEYECSACHKRTEKIQKFSDPEITVCPKCGGVLERVLSAPAIAFKGGGWYADGYGSAKPAAASGDSGESGDSGKSESKPWSESGSKSGSESGSKSGSESATPAAPAPAAAPAAASTPAAPAPASKS